MIHLSYDQMPEKDIERRRLGQKLDPVTGDVYTRDVYAPDKPVPPVRMKGRHIIMDMHCSEY